MPVAVDSDPAVANGTTHDSTSIAVIGLACRFPGDASNPERFWEMLCQGRSAYSESNRYNVNAFHSSVEGKINTSRPRGAHFLREDVAAFDANFFTVNENEAIAMDPQSRIMLEIAYEAFENSGLSLENVAGTNTSCFIGNFTTDYREMLLRDPDAAPRYSFSGLGQEMLSNRLSWFYDLKGASSTVSTACSSSLVALHQGCQSLRMREAEMSIVGGCNLLLNPDMFLLLSNMQFLAQDGRCKSFDAKGDGYGRGEGFAAVMLKRVEDAVRDGDPIRAVIRGTGVNHDGHTKGLTVPSAEAQADLIRFTYSRAGLNFDNTNYVESHGTGTKAGDPSELEAVSNTICSSRKHGQGILVGSVKPNIGHLEATAGLAGLIKAIYILERALIPPNILFEEPNPQIPFEKWKIHIPTKVTAWPTEGLRRISVQGFGYGGTNAHAILDDAFHYLSKRGFQAIHRAHISTSNKFNGVEVVDGPRLKTSSKPADNGLQTTFERESKRARIFILTSHDRNGLKRQRESLFTHLDSLRFEDSHATSQLLRNLAFTLSEKRSRLAWKTYASASSLDELLSALHTKDSEITAFRSSATPRLGFIFTGQGSQWAQMGIELNQYPVFRRSIETSDRYLRSALGCTWSAVEEMCFAEGHSQINNPAFAQPLCTILQIALVDLLESWNVVPSAVVGHSSGEIAAAYCLGALTREDALKAAYYRGLLATGMKQLAPSLKGAMLAVGASESQAQDWIDELDPASGQVGVACINSPSSVTLSGDVSGIDELHKMLKQKSVFARKLKVDTAYHSPHMNVVAMQYLESLSSIQPKPAHESCRMYSAVTGCAVESSELGAMNWVRNLVSPVLFYDALHQMLQPSQQGENSAAGSINVLLELGPHSTLQGSVNQTLTKHDIRNVSYLSTLIRGRNATETAIAAVGALFAQGVPVNLNEVNIDADDTTVEPPALLVDLPPYAWNHSRTFWGESRVSKEYRLRKSPRLNLLGVPYPKIAGQAHHWKGQIAIDEQPWIRDHKIQTSILYPAAGYLAMAVEGAAQIATEGQEIKNFRLKDVQIVAPAVMSESSDLECTLEVRPHRTGSRDARSTWLEFSISSCHRGEDLRENCFGLLQIQYQASENSSMSFEHDWEHSVARTMYHETEKICNISEDPREFYAELASIGLNYGSTFQNLTHIRRAPSKSCFTITMLDPESSRCADRQHIIHPTNLDSMFHGVFAAFKEHLKDAMVPTSIEEVVISAHIPFASGSLSRGFSQVSEHGFRELMADLVMFDEDLVNPTVTVRGFHCSRISGAGANATDGIDQAKPNIFSKMLWKPAVELLMSDQVSKLFGPTTPSASSVSSKERVEQCEFQVFRFIQRALKETSIDRVINIQLREFYIWMQEQQRLVQDYAHPLQTVKRDFFDDRKISANMQGELEKDCVESRVIHRVGTSITSILNGVVDAKQLVLEEGLINQWSSELLGLDECFGNLGKYIDLLAHHQPTLSILEIGGITGGAAPFIKPNESKNPGSSLTLSRYIFSRPTDAESSRAEQRLGSLTNRVEFKTLAIDRDPSSQGFSNSAFDVIICSSLDPSFDSDRTLANIRRLLKSDGKLCIVSISNPGLRLPFVLRSVQARSNSDKSRVPIDRKALEGILKRHDLSSKFSITDFESTEHQHLSVTIATPSVSIQNEVQRHEIVILEPPESTHTVDALAAQLSSDLESHMIIPKRVRWRTDLEDLNDKECICLMELEKPLLEDIGDEDFAKIQKLVSSPLRLLWVTSLDTPAGALAVGMARSIRNEIAGKQFRTVSIQDKSTGTLENLTQLLVQLAITPTIDSEFLEEDGVLKTCRLIEDASLDEIVSQTRAEGKDRIESVPLEKAIGPQKLAIQNQGMLDSICLEADDLAAMALGDDEVEIEVKATGLNFRDVMVALGQIPDNLLGFDASGVVTRVGKEVSQFKAGDKVCTLGHGTHRTHFRNKADFCQAIPDGLTFDEAATLPLVHCTAFHALINVARVSPKQTILIHAAAGGVGQAAIQLALHFGLEIFATVGLSEKREMLQELYGIPGDHIFNSRDLSFAKGVLRMTNGRGVDCVLNSLSGQALQETWRCIAPFGTFVEIGLRDIMDNTGLAMRHFAQDATFSFLNLKHVMTDKPKLLTEILKGTFDFFRQGISRPVTPVTTYPISAVEDAFRLMQTGKHLGKIAIAWSGSEVVPVLHRPRASLILRPDATYVLCGGFGGLGQSLATWLVHLGARNLCFISRSGKKFVEAKKLVEMLELQNIRVQVFSCDISNKGDLTRTLQECSQSMPPIKGVIQCAMVLRDASFETMPHSHWTESLRPKVQGTWNLHLLLSPALEFFITLSSFTGIFGNRTQSNYAAAGAFQDAIAHYRVARGLKAVTVDLGIMRDVGVIAEHGVTGPLKEWEESFGIREKELHLMMRTIITKELDNPSPSAASAMTDQRHTTKGATMTIPPQILTGFATGGTALAAGIRTPFYFSDPRFSHLALTGLSGSSNHSSDSPAPASDSTHLQNFALLASSDPEAAKSRLTAALVARVAKSLQTDVAEITDTRPLHSYGVDSLVAIEIANWLFGEVHVTVTMFEILAGVPIAGFAGKLVEKARGVAEGESKVAG